MDPILGDARTGTRLRGPTHGLMRRMTDTAEWTGVDGKLGSFGTYTSPCLLLAIAASTILSEAQFDRVIKGEVERRPVSADSSLKGTELKKSLTDSSVPVGCKLVEGLTTGAENQGRTKSLTQEGSRWDPMVNFDSAVISSNGSSSSMGEIIDDSSWIMPTLQTLAHRVFRMVRGQDGYYWPELKLGQPRTILGILLGGVGAGLSSAGGLGGGGLFVPLFNLLLQFDSKTSAALSNFMILGGSTVNLWINLRQHHPVWAHKPLIDFDVLLLMQPNMLLGISIGVILNVILPAWFITASLAVVLGYMTIHSFKGGCRRWARETEQNGARNFEFSDEESVTPPELPASKNGVGKQGEQGAVNPGPPNSLTKPLLNDDKTAVTKEEPEQLVLFPWRKIGALVIVWFLFFGIQVLRGGKGGTSVVGIQQCGLGYWLLTLTQVPLTLVLTAWTISQLRSTRKEGRQCDMQEEGYVLGPKSGTMFPSMALVAGILGGMLGIGGGMIINPLLFTVGMLPQVTAATCASMVFFSSSMSVIQFWLMGRIPIQYALIACVLCAVFSWVGIKVVHRIIAIYNRASLIVFSVAAVMGVSAVLMVGFGGWDVWEQYRSGVYMGFHYPC
ncbi:hypothetical protein R1sor_022067 [Riccia sorocarpa]|uniref:Sulfite exporter TauE/SafE family protein n=1 Tax=Riccia sorocarpa TaxID=122646 RepID=A0ABD3GKI4_9MARC